MYDIQKKEATAKYCKEIVQCAMLDVLKTNVKELNLLSLSLYVSYISTKHCKIVIRL